MNFQKAYNQRIFIAAILYAITLVVSIEVLKRMSAESVLRIPVALLPVIPVAFGVVAFMRYIRQLDELQRRIQLEGLAFSIGCTGMLTFALGFLENAGMPPVNIIWVLPILLVFWGIGTTLARRRY
jgi:amino acid transporter